MKYDTVLALRDGWFKVSGDSYTPIEPWARLHKPTMLVTDFDGAPIGMHRFEGRPAHAKAIIEKHVRAQGLSEGASHIVIHHAGQVANGAHCMYTAIPLDTWQKLQQWVSAQKDHCLPIAIGSLLLLDLKKGQARITTVGRDFHMAGRNDAGIFYANMSAISTTDDDFSIAIRALYTQTRKYLAAGIKSPVQWASIQSIEVDTESKYAALFTKISQFECALLRSDESQTKQPSDKPALVAFLCKRLPLKTTQASLLIRLAWLAESLVIPVAAMTAFAGAAMLFVGMQLQVRANHENLVAVELAKRASTLENRVALANAIETPTGFAPVAAFAQQLGDGATYDPVAMLQLVREAAGQDILIQRVRLEPYADKKRAFRIDGMTAKSGLAAITRFLAVTRSAGWRAEAMDPAEQLPGAFSYRLIASSQ